MRIGRFCISWKVVGALVMVGVAVWAIAPHAVVRTLPFLGVLVCPLSMMLMMRGMGGMNADQQAAPDSEHVDEKSLTRSDRLAELEARLARADAERNAVARDIAALREENPESAALGTTNGDRHH